MQKTILSLILILFCFWSNAQNNHLQQTWILTATANCNEAFDVSGNSNPFIFEFGSNDTVALYSAKNQVLKSYQGYTLTEKELKLEYNQYEIELISQDTLILLTKLDTSCTKSLLLTHNSIQNIQLQDFFLNDNDTIYHPSMFNYPTIDDKTADFYFQRETMKK